MKRENSPCGGVSPVTAAKANDRDQCTARARTEALAPDLEAVKALVGRLLAAPGHIWRPRGGGTPPEHQPGRDAPKREDKYHRTALDNMQLGDVSTDQLQHYLACRRVMEEHLDEESVFVEVCRLAMQSDEETNDWFDRITRNGTKRFQKAEKLASEMLTVGNTASSKVTPDRLGRIALGMLEDGWAEHQVAYALETLGAA